VLEIVAADQDELAPSIHLGNVNDGEPRLASASPGIRQALAPNPAHEPQRQHEDTQCHDEREQHLEGVAFKQAL
jgi:hypothetical protein